MRILVDANVFLDVVFRRRAWRHSLTTIWSVEEGLVKGFITAHTSTVIWFVTRDYLGELHARVRCRPRRFEIIPLTASILEAAVGHTGPELEDNIQIVSAQLEDIDYIVTRNLRHFVTSQVPAITPEEFWLIYRAPRT